MQRLRLFRQTSMLIIPTLLSVSLRIVLETKGKIWSTISQIFDELLSMIMCELIYLIIVIIRRLFEVTSFYKKDSGYTKVRIFLENINILSDIPFSFEKDLLRLLSSICKANFDKLDTNLPIKRFSYRHNGLCFIEKV